MHCGVLGAGVRSEVVVLGARAMRGPKYGAPPDRQCALRSVIEARLGEASQ